GEVCGMGEETDDARQAADDVLAGVRAALRRLEAIPDAAVRARAAGLVLREWPAERGLAKEVRQQAVDWMHREQGLDFPEIGRLIGTDRSRAWRIWKGMSWRGVTGVGRSCRVRYALGVTISAPVVGRPSRNATTPRHWPSG